MTLVLLVGFHFLVLYHLGLLVEAAHVVLQLVIDGLLFLKLVLKLLDDLVQLGDLPLKAGDDGIA